MITAMTGLFFAALTFAAKNGVPDPSAPPLPPATIGETILIAIVTIAIELPIKAFYVALFEKVRPLHC